MKKRSSLNYIFVVLWCLLIESGTSYAFSINLTHPENSVPLVIRVDTERSVAYGWKPGQVLDIQVYGEVSVGQKKFLTDIDDRDRWQLVLDQNASGSLSIHMDKKSHSGALFVTANSKSLFTAGDALNPDGYHWVEKIREYRAGDGVVLRVHYTDQMLAKYGVTNDLPGDVLNAAVHGYQTITEFEGFASKNYSFAEPDPSYAMDPDKTIDIYLGDPSGFNGYELLGIRNNLFKDAPCFDTIKLSETEYQAVILLPANYYEFIRNWEKINPSPLGRRNIGIDLRGTLIHEMLHVVLFYYNKNLNKSVEDAAMGGHNDTKDLDWYVEGLARYFETFAGARHDFYSQGFKQTLPDRIRFSRGGSNYFMRYPDQAFTQLRYENALFWRYLDDRYGMEAIESLSRDFRDKDLDFQVALERMTGKDFETLLRDYAKATLLKDFGLKDDSAYLNDVARTRLVYKDRQWYLRGGDDDTMSLGKTCETDWVGQWENVHARFAEPSVAGDSTRISDVSGWATDYVEITKDKVGERWPKIHVRGNSKSLMIQVLGLTKGGSLVEKWVGSDGVSAPRTVDLSEIVRSESLSDEDVDKFYFLLTNTDPRSTVEYSLTLVS
jgi:hypothetical protein